MNSPHVLTRADFDTLLAALHRRGYTCVGPTVRDGAIVYGTLRRAADLPEGWTDEQGPGHYRLRERPDRALFGYVVGPHSWKKFTFPAERRLWRLRRTEQGFEPVEAANEDGEEDGEESRPHGSTGQGSAAPGTPARLAFLGVRACEIAALQIQDRVFTGGKYADPHYAGVRSQALIVSVSCTQSAATCFCTSMKTGPQVNQGFDLDLTEILDGAHRFLVRAGSDLGRAILDELPLRPAEDADLEAATAGVARAAQQQRKMDPEGLPELLQQHAESPQWEDIAERCLACANCTMTCPTCFCSDVEDVTDLTGEHAERWRRWDSCFNPGFSALHGVEVRGTTASRYRQWMSHKLGTWVQQFGSSGCVGCGRCITWCPVGIDLTEEVARMRETS